MPRIHLPYWQSRPYGLLLTLLSGLPFWWPALPPLVDLMGHMGRYRIQLGIDSSTFFQHYYDVHWSLIANLGVDVLMQTFAPIFGLEPLIKAIVIAIPMMTVAGLLWIAREAHGRLPATAAFALPLSIGYPLHFGFINFTLSTSLALLAFGLWLRMDRLGQYRWRAALFMPIGLLLWVAHIYGWGLLGLLVFVHEWHKAGLRRILTAALHSLPLLPPLLLMAIWHDNGMTVATAEWFNLTLKMIWLSFTLRDRFMWLDAGSVFILIALIYAAARRHGLRMQAMLGRTTAALAIAYICMPRILLGSDYADMRLAPFLLAIGVIGISTSHLTPRTQQMLALFALGFFLLRTGISAQHFIALDRQYARQLEALPHVPRNSRVFSLINMPCQRNWDTSRMDHLSSMATVRRDAFVNDQWEMTGAQLLRVHYPAAGKWAVNPSQIARPGFCPTYNGVSEEQTYAQAMTGFPRRAYDYLWLIDFPPERLPVDDKGLTLIWQGKTSGALYRIGSATQASDTPAGNDPRASQ
ncbi:hypothetical protein [Aquisediminimonas sediminicola]|uniref:hypothetical protein n=1 Tax=Alteraquisediminimonas sediminicola TaxID=2676787 RepID=UPI001C8EA103|nr:hypothetical protein [Aquisediminimonas sediminicola]